MLNAGAVYLMQFVLQRLLVFSRPLLIGREYSPASTFGGLYAVLCSFSTSPLPLLIGREYSPARALSGLVCCFVLLSFSSIVNMPN
jgi:hypothetical protein